MIPQVLLYNFYSFSFRQMAAPTLSLGLLKFFSTVVGVLLVVVTGLWEQGFSIILCGLNPTMKSTLRYCMLCSGAKQIKLKWAELKCNSQGAMYRLSCPSALLRHYNLKQWPLNRKKISNSSIKITFVYFGYIFTALIKNKVSVK